MNELIIYAINDGIVLTNFHRCHDYGVVNGRRTPGKNRSNAIQSKTSQKLKVKLLLKLKIFTSINRISLKFESLRSCI